MVFIYLYLARLGLHQLVVAPEAAVVGAAGAAIYIGAAAARAVAAPTIKQQYRATKEHHYADHNLIKWVS